MICWFGFDVLAWICCRDGLTLLVVGFAFVGFWLILWLVGSRQCFGLLVFFCFVGAGLVDFGLFLAWLYCLVILRVWLDFGLLGISGLFGFRVVGFGVGCDFGLGVCF